MKRFLILCLALTGGIATAADVGSPIQSKDERRPMRILQTTPLIFPQTLLDDGITTGSARVAITLDNTGVLTDVLVVSYTHEEFGEAAERALREWKFEPIRVLNEDVATQALVHFKFEAKGVVISIDTGDEINLLTAFRRGDSYGPCPLRRLDRIPTPISFVEPVYPKDLKLHGVEGQAVLEFYIDENGSVRVPAVVDADFWELGVLAMNAVRQWKFEPPTSKGRPVLVRVRQAFYFTGAEKVQSASVATP